MEQTRGESFDNGAPVRTALGLPPPWPKDKPRPVVERDLWMGVGWGVNLDGLQKAGDSGRQWETVGDSGSLLLGVC